MKWKTVVTDMFELEAPIQMWEGNEGNGTYHIIIQKRPSYCDRGDWIIYVDGRNDLDSCDGFPRYFFGTKAQVKAQMETWLSRRAAYKAMKNKNAK